MLRRDIKDTSAVKDALESANEERGKEFESRSKVLAHLLPNATESRERLKGIIKKIEAKIATLKEAFDAMKKEKENEYQLLLRKKEVNLSQQSEEVQMMSLIKDKLGDSEKKYREKEVLHKKYSTAINKVRPGSRDLTTPSASWTTCTALGSNRMRRRTFLSISNKFRRTSICWKGNSSGRMGRRK